MISRELMAIALCASLVACAGGDGGDDTGTTDTDVSTDTGDTDTGDTDTGPVEPTCGDGTVDEGEACDEGALNGPDGSCSTDCEWNDWQSCDTYEVAVLDTTSAQPDGRYHLSQRFTADSALSTSCAGTATHDALVELTLPAAGTWLLSTDNAQTLAPTALSLRTDCDDRSELACSAGGTAGPNGAQQVIVDGQAGDTFVALIENLGTAQATWHLSLGPVDGVANEGGTCSDTLPCEDGTVCVDGTCLPIEGPSITDASLVQTGTYDYLLTVSGTDPNRDATALSIVEIVDIYGDVWGDEAGEEPVVVDSRIAWSGESFTATSEVSIAYSGTGLADAVTIDAVITDVSGLSSSAVELTYPTAESNVTQAYAGDACDMCVDCSGNTNGFPRSCNPNPHTDPNDSSVTIPGLECTWTDRAATEATCEDKNVNLPPEVNSLSMYWAGTESMLLLEAFDFRHYSGMRAHLVAVTTAGESFDLGSAYLPGELWEGGVMTARGAFDASEVADIDYLEVLVEDNGYPSAITETAVTVDWVDYTAPVEVGAGEACDLLGWETSCPEDTVCSPTLSGVPGCLPNEAPELVWATGVYAGGFFPSMTIDFEAYDANGNWAALVVESVKGTPSAGDAYGFDTAWLPSPFGQQSYTGAMRAPYADWLMRVVLEDTEGARSESAILSGVDSLATGDACNTGTCTFFGCQPPVSFCDVEAGDTCAIGATTPVCETNEAPVLASATVRRTGASRYLVEFDGTDLNGDALKAVLLVDEGEGFVRKPVTLDRDLPIEGSTSFISSFTGTLDTPEANATIRLSLQDWGFAESNVLELPVPPIVEAGGTCSGDDTIDACVEGSECIDGTCFAFEPQVTGATLAFTNYDRDAVLTITGQDDATGANQQLRTATVTIAGETYEASMSQYNTDWNGNTFSFDLSLPRLGTGALIDQLYVSVTVTDLGGFSDSGTFFITPHVGFGGTCDVDGVLDTCHAGLACDSTGACDNATDACAGIPTTVVDSDVMTWTFATSGQGLDTYSAYDTCGASNNPNGLEQAFVYTATQDGTLTITSASTDGDAHPGYLFVRAAECVNEAAVVGCSNHIPNGSTVPNNSVSLPVLTGDVLYVTVDGPSWKKGAGTLTFAY